MQTTAFTSEFAAPARPPFRPNQRQWEDFQKWKSLGPDLCADTLFKWLLSDDKERIELAEAIFLEFGAPAVPLLVEVAVLPRKSEVQRIRLLEVIEKIGMPLGLDEFFGLMELSRRSTGPVQAMIMQLLMTLPKASGPRDGELTPAMPTIAADPSVNEFQYRYR
jgi:hypothetical protein